MNVKGTDSVSTNLHTVSNQWPNRPDDNRFLDLESLQESVDARRSLSRQRVIRLNQLEAVNVDNAVALQGMNGHAAAMTHWSFSQLASLVKAPAAYLRGLHPSLAAANLDYGLHFSDDARDETKLLYSEDGSVGELRAATGPKYGRIWDSQIVSAVRRMNSDGRWSVPLQAYGGQNSKRATTLYASDRDVFVFLVDEKNPIDVNGDTFFRGFYTWNSEVGKATFGLATFLYSYVCQNRIIWGARDIEELRICHTSLAPERFIEQATPALAAIADSSPQPIVKAIREAQDTHVARKATDVEKWLESKGFGRFESKVAVQLAARGGDTGSHGDPTNLWDIVQGGTAAAREISHQDTRLEAEKKWSSLLRFAGQPLVVPEEAPF